jgi:hypothetical protein
VLSVAGSVFKGGQDVAMLALTAKLGSEIQSSIREALASKAPRPAIKPLQFELLRRINNPTNATQLCTHVREYQTKATKKGKKGKRSTITKYRPCRSLAVSGFMVCTKHLNEQQSAAVFDLVKGVEARVVVLPGRKRKKQPKTLTHSRLRHFQTNATEQVNDQLSEATQANWNARVGTKAAPILVHSDSDDPPTKTTAVNGPAPPLIRKETVLAVGDVVPVEAQHADKLSIEIVPLPTAKNKKGKRKGRDYADGWPYSLVVGFTDTGQDQGPDITVSRSYHGLSSASFWSQSMVDAPVRRKANKKARTYRFSTRVGNVVDTLATLVTAAQVLIASGRPQIPSASNESQWNPMCSRPVDGRVPPAASPTSTSDQQQPAGWAGPAGVWKGSPVETGRRGALACVLRVFGRAISALNDARALRADLHAAGGVGTNTSSSVTAPSDIDGRVASVCRNGRILANTLAHGVRIARTADPINQADLQSQLFALEAHDHPLGLYPSNSSVGDTTPLFRLPAKSTPVQWAGGWDQTETKCLELQDQGSAGSGLVATQRISKGSTVLTLEFTAIETDGRVAALDGPDTWRIVHDSEPALADQSLTLVLRPGSPAAMIQSPNGNDHPNMEMKRTSAVFGQADSYVFVARDNIAPGATLTIDYGDLFVPNIQDLSNGQGEDPTHREEWLSMRAKNPAMCQFFKAKLPDESWFPAPAFRRPMTEHVKNERTRRRTLLAMRVMAGSAPTPADAYMPLYDIQSFKPAWDCLVRWSEMDEARGFPTFSDIQSEDVFRPTYGRPELHHPWKIGPDDDDPENLRAQNHVSEGKMHTCVQQADGTWCWEWPDRPPPSTTKAYAVNPTEARWDFSQDYGNPSMYPMSMSLPLPEDDPPMERGWLPQRRDPKAVRSLVEFNPWPQEFGMLVAGILENPDNVLGPDIPREMHRQSRLERGESLSELMGIGTYSCCATPFPAKWYGSGLHTEPGLCTTMWSSVSGSSIIGCLTPEDSVAAANFHTFYLGERVPRMYTPAIARCMTFEDFGSLPVAAPLPPPIYVAMGIRPLVTLAPAGTVVFVPRKQAHWLIARPGSERLVAGGLSLPMVLENITGRPCTVPLFGRSLEGGDVAEGMWDEEYFNELGPAIVAVLKTSFYDLDPTEFDHDLLVKWMHDVGDLMQVADTPDFRAAVDGAKWMFPNRPDLVCFPNNFITSCDVPSWRFITQRISLLSDALKRAETVLVTEHLATQSPPAKFFGFHEWDGDTPTSDSFFLATSNTTAAAIGFENAHTKVKRTVQRKCRAAATEARLAAIAALDSAGPSQLVTIHGEDTPREAWKCVSGMTSPADAPRWQTYLRRHRTGTEPTDHLIRRASAVASETAICIHLAPTNPLPREGAWDTPARTIAPSWLEDSGAPNPTMGQQPICHTLCWDGFFFGLARKDKHTTEPNKARDKSGKADRRESRERSVTDAEDEEEEEEDEPKATQKKLVRRQVREDEALARALADGDEQGDAEDPKLDVNETSSSDDG